MAALWPLAWQLISASVLICRERETEKDRVDEEKKHTTHTPFRTEYIKILCTFISHSLLCCIQDRGVFPVIKDLLLGKVCCLNTVFSKENKKKKKGKLTSSHREQQSAPRSSRRLLNTAPRACVYRAMFVSHFCFVYYFITFPSASLRVLHVLFSWGRQSRYCHFFCTWQKLFKESKKQSGWRGGTHGWAFPRLLVCGFPWSNVSQSCIAAPWCDGSDHRRG